MKSEVARSMVSTEATSGGFVAEFRFAPDLDVFEGHFPDHPLVPGVYLLEAVRCAAERVLHRTLRVSKVSRAKFKQPVLPGDRVQLEVAMASDGDEWDCRATIVRPAGEGTELVSKTRMRLH